MILVPTPNATVTALNTQIVGQSLILQCEVATVRGITNRVDIVWSSNDIVLRRINDTMATIMDNSLVYADSYNISQLSTIDDGRVIQCEVVINASPPIIATDNITLNVMGMYIHCLTVLLYYGGWADQRLVSALAVLHINRHQMLFTFINGNNTDFHYPSL